MQCSILGKTPGGEEVDRLGSMQFDFLLRLSWRINVTKSSFYNTMRLFNNLSASSHLSHLSSQ